MLYHSRNDEKSISSKIWLNKKQDGSCKIVRSTDYSNRRLNFAKQLTLIGEEYFLDYQVCKAQIEAIVLSNLDYIFFNVSLHSRSSKIKKD